ncbi:LOB domain-containing protein [Salix suchowensis]|nr:LOB domain-containing protein [Salix suchowensis]
MQRGSNSSNINNRMLAHPACASCKHQRKRCTENCALAPYFPAEKTLEFQAVHKVFGVSNVVKLVKDVIAERRKETVDSLVWEALCRQNDPILGCYGKLKRLQEEFDSYRTQHPSLNQNQLVQHHGSVVFNSKQSPTMVRGLASNNMQERDASSLLLLQSRRRLRRCHNTIPSMDLINSNTIFQVISPYANYIDICECFAFIIPNGISYHMCLL